MAVTLTNTSSLNAQTNLAVYQKKLHSALEKLSSGSKINHASDDPAGMLMALQMTNTINGETAGTYNLNMAVDLLNTADSYINVIGSNLQDMNNLAVQSANGLLSADQRGALQSQFGELVDEIGRLTSNASYNGRPLLTGSLAGVTVQTGASATDTVTLSIGTMTIGAGGLNISGLGISTAADARNAMIQINAAVVNVLAPNVAGIGAQSAGWMKSIPAQERYTTNLMAARSRVADADLASEMTNLTNYQVLTQSGTAAIIQSHRAHKTITQIFGMNTR